MRTRILLPLLLVVLSVTSTGCTTVATQLAQDRRDTAWDPKPKTGAQLFDQIPSWEGAANTVCCGHLRQCKPNQSPRC